MNCVNQHLKKEEGNCIKACLKSQIFTRQSFKIKMEIVFAKMNVKWTLQQSRAVIGIHSKLTLIDFVFVNFQTHFRKKLDF